MRDDLFNELVESVKEGGVLLRKGCKDAVETMYSEREERVEMGRQREMLYWSWRERESAQAGSGSRSSQASEYDPEGSSRSLEEQKETLKEINQELAKCRQVLEEIKAIRRSRQNGAV